MVFVRKNATTSVGCGECDSWFHYNCQNLKHHPIEELQTLPLEFICIDCCTRWGYFQFQHSLQRLSLAASESMTALKNAARMEHMLLCDHTIYAAETITPLGLPQDVVSNQLIAVSGGMADKCPFQTSTDGNCLFNSASIATFGDQTKAAKLCVLTCIEMLEHSDYYKRQHKTTGCSSRVYWAISRQHKYSW